MRSFILPAIMAGSVALAGCAGNYAGEGALAGGAVGAAIGAADGDIGEGAAIGAAAGAVGGALIKKDRNGRCWYRDRDGRRYHDRC